ncbi:site-specific integrase [Paracoccus liaowanqingii]|nr:site-specific integrase [Paracoccus liaowanqingii]
MRYDAIRQHVQEHFRGMLGRFTEGISIAGPVDERRLASLRVAQDFADNTADDWADAIHQDGGDGLLREFCALRGIPESDLTTANRALLLDALRQGHLAYATAALGHIDALANFDLLSPPSVHAAPSPPSRPVAPPTVPDAKTYREVVGEYLSELRRAAGLAPKTFSQKQEVLALLGEITEQQPVSELTKADARKVKDVLLRYPQNRQKKAATKGKPLADILDLPGVACISGSTVNTYLSHMHSFMQWAVDNGHAEEDIFDGMRVKVKAAKADRRDAFTTDQLREMFLHLTDDPLGLARADAAKWGGLLGMFTGMRLNEIAQLEVGDIREVEGIWCIDVSDVGEGSTKRLKTAAADRRVPVHDRLMAAGFLEFVAAQRGAGHTRLFPRLSYCPKNGYGRAIGRWFNNTLLNKLSMKSKTIVFHSFRHTMNTRLHQADVDGAMVRAIIGHEQQGVSTGTYFKEGFRLAQLKTAIDRFEF